MLTVSDTSLPTDTASAFVSTVTVIGSAASTAAEHENTSRTASKMLSIRVLFISSSPFHVSIYLHPHPAALRDAGKPEFRRKRLLSQSV